MKRLAALAALAALALPARALADADVALTTIGYDPAVVTIRAGESIHWTNTTVLPHSVTSATGLFDSGEIPPGGGYSMTFSVPGSHTYGSSEAIGFSGTIRVVATGLPGAATDLAVGRIPDLPFARDDAANIAAHPQWGVEASTVPHPARHRAERRGRRRERGARGGRRRGRGRPARAEGDPRRGRRGPDLGSRSGRG